jgi:hypothetical protein
MQCGSVRLQRTFYRLHELDIGNEQASEGVCWQIDEYRSNKKLD